jgi:hypothetical protein
VSALACSEANTNPSNPVVDSGASPDTRSALDATGPDVTDTGLPGTIYGGPPPPTVFEPCTSDESCAEGWGSEYCSLFNPTPMCIGEGCSAVGATCGPAARGLCLGFGASNECHERCEFTDTGFTKLCSGKNKCTHWATRTTDGVALGVGFCAGGCKADADCAIGRCQLETGGCTDSPRTFTKTLGTACSATDVAACLCLREPTGGGYCSTICYVGETMCAVGFTCDAGLPKSKILDAEGVFTKQPVGLTAYCLKNCVDDTDCAGLNAYCDESAGTAQKTCKVGKRPCAKDEHCPTGQTCMGATTTVRGSCG